MMNLIRLILSLEDEMHEAAKELHDGVNELKRDLGEAAEAG
jgi:hypothetical protein